MADIQVTTNQSVIEVTQNNGITVTTPTGQIIDVTVPSSDVNVTTTTVNITIPGGLYTGAIIPDARKNVPITIVPSALKYHSLVLLPTLSTAIPA